MKRMTTPVLVSQGLTKSYGSTHALAGVDLTVQPGESLAIMGASGSGKTTLLHCLAGIVVPDGGSVRFSHPSGPVSIEKLSETARSRLRRESFGFVFQQGLLIPELTARENVALALMLNGSKRTLAEEYATGWLASLGLVGLEDRRIGQLSGGQAQRVAIARALVMGPAVIFADEPTGALDSHTSVEVMDALLASTVGSGKALVLVTHDVNVAARCGRIVTVRDGRVETTAASAGPAAAVAPADPAAAVASAGPVNGAAFPQGGVA
jgi:putative ABC transport system ATP-binding protein